METTAVLQKTKWKIDPIHSEVRFQTKHLGISNLTGSFRSFSGEVMTQSEDFEDAQIEFSLDVNSLTTNQAMRDQELNGTEFFDSDNYPQITFKSTSFLKSKNGGYILTGNLKIKDISKEMKAIVEFGGMSKDNQGTLKAGFELTASLNRKDFGLSYNSMNENGVPVVSDEVLLMANIEIAKEKVN